MEANECHIIIGAIVEGKTCNELKEMEPEEILEHANFRETQEIHDQSMENRDKKLRKWRNQ